VSGVNQRHQVSRVGDAATESNGLRTVRVDTWHAPSSQYFYWRVPLDNAPRVGQTIYINLAWES
jgi:hypothetical protein